MENEICCRQVSMVRNTVSGGRRQILKHICARFPAGSISEVNGPNGAGKSTLLYVMAGLLRPTEGEVLFNEAPVSRWSAGHRDRWRRQVGIVFQDLHLLEDVTALENVMVPLIPRGLSVGELRRKAFSAMERIGAADLASLPVARMSGGQRQRIAIARSVVNAPALLLADEPAAHQDCQGKDLLRVLFSDLKQQGVTIVVVGGREPALYNDGRTDFSFEMENGELKGPS